jgi:nitrite reductase (NO-forming)
LSKNYFQLNKVARIITLTSIVAALATSGVLISYYSNTSTITTNEEKKIGSTIEAAASSTSSSSNNNNNNSNSSAPASRKEYTLIAQDAELEIAPGKVVKTWTFNGTMPAPTLRFTEGENVSIKFINKTPTAHTIHFHGNHDDANDGVFPQIMPNESYTYNITAAPAGALMYHCHAMPTSLHIRMGMYGAMIVDPIDKPLEPAREFVMVMSEFDSKNIMEFETEYYPINGYADMYVTDPLEINHDELIRLYVMNIGTTIPYQFHLHSTTFKAYPSGLWSNEPIDAQTFPVGPGDATIIEARWKYPGVYLFHSHGFQEERGNIGQIVVSAPDGGNQSVAPLTESISMFDWQYELQKQLQKPNITNYEEQVLNNAANAARSALAAGGGHGHGLGHVLPADNPSNITTYVQPTANGSGTRINAPTSSGTQ